MATIDLATLQPFVDQGYLSMREHPTAALRIYNYTQRAQFDRAWTPETLRCRGLIVRPDGQIVARPFSKFFNLEEHIGLFGPLPIEPFEVYEKLDGSLGILYWLDGAPALATRGSFISEQAATGTRILRERYAGAPFLRDHTYLFEIIYPSNRIVVDYGDREDLILLAIIDTETGAERPIYEQPSLPFPIATRYDGVTDLASVKALGRQNQEGFVIRFQQSGLRVKIKLDEYIRLHRLLTGVNARVVWELLATGQSLDALLDHVPDEFYAWVRATSHDLLTRYAAIEAACQASLASLRALPTRKEQAAIVTRTPYPAVLFKMLDEKPHSDTIWKLLRPSAENPFRLDTDA